MHREGTKPSRAGHIAFFLQSQGPTHRVLRDGLPSLGKAWIAPLLALELRPNFTHARGPAFPLFALLRLSEGAEQPIGLGRGRLCHDARSGGHGSGRAGRRPGRERNVPRAGGRQPAEMFGARHGRAATEQKAGGDDRERTQRGRLAAGFGVRGGGEARSRQAA
jgi:hypothetical protein